MVQLGGAEQLAGKNFDATQVMSVDCAALVAEICVWIKKVTSTLDWLRSGTEVFEDAKLAKWL